MSDEARERSRALVTGLIIGSLAGMLVGVLVAPQEGERTRQALRDRMADLATAGAAIGGLLADVATDTASTVADQVGGAAGKVRSAVGDDSSVRRVVAIGKEAAARELERLSGTYRAIAQRGAADGADQTAAAAEIGDAGPELEPA